MGVHAPRSGASSQPTERELGLGDGQIHRGKDHARFEGLILADKGMVVPPDGGKDGADQDEDGDVIKGLDRVRVGEEEAADEVRGPGSFLHILRQCALPHFLLFGAAEKEVLACL